MFKLSKENFIPWLFVIALALLAFLAVFAGVKVVQQTSGLDQWVSLVYFVMALIPIGIIVDAFWPNQF